MRKGFTLIELLVVVLIIGILAAIALPQYTKSVERSRAANAVVWIKAAADSLQRYAFENPDAGSFMYQINADGSSSGSADSLDITLPAAVGGYEWCEVRFKFDDATASSALCHKSKYDIGIDIFTDGYAYPYCASNGDPDGDAMCKGLGYSVASPYSDTLRHCLGDADHGINGGCWVQK